MSGCHVKPEQMFNLIFGYNDNWYENLSFTADAADDSNPSDSVPSDEVWVLQSISIFNLSAADSTHFADVYDSGGDRMRLFRETGVGQFIPATWTGDLALGHGDYVLLGCAGIAAGNVVHCGVRGYKMKLTQ